MNVYHTMLACKCWNRFRLMLTEIRTLSHHFVAQMGFESVDMRVEV